MLTGWAQTIEKDDPRRRWVKDVLQKPMRPETLRELLVNELVGDRDASPGSGPAHDIVSAHLRGDQRQASFALRIRPAPCRLSSAKKSQSRATTGLVSSVETLGIDANRAADEGTAPSKKKP